LKNLEEKYPVSILSRSFAFGVKVVRLASLLPKNPAGFVLADQLVRSGTSIGANLVEAQEAHSQKDFLYKVVFALKEAKETKYWLDILGESKLLTGVELEDLRREISEITRILVVSVKKLKEKQSK